MDMRTFGKSFQRYRDRAENENGVRFERGRVHSIFHDENSGDLIIRYADYTGAHMEEIFDMAVLSVGQRPALGTTALAELVEMPLNQWGFGQTEPFSLTRTNKEGIVLGGSFSGLKDISESVIQASAAALSASRIIHAAGGSLSPTDTPVEPFPDVSQEPPRAMIAVCSCGDILSKLLDTQQLARRLKVDPAVDQVAFIEQVCTVTGWEALVERVEKYKPNRILIGACLADVYTQKIGTMGRRVGLNPALIEVVDLKLTAQSAKLKYEPSSEDEMSKVNSELLAVLRMGLARLKWVDPDPVPVQKIRQQALVVGGGIAGMSSALAIADHGFRVELIEQEEMLGGNLNWLQRTLEGNPTKTLLDETLLKVEKHPLIRVHANSRVRDSHGRIGHFYTTIENKDNGAFTLEHGVTILATGGAEADTTSYNYGASEAIVTQKELERKINDNALDPDRLGSIVMIQCVDSRQEPRNYCSRICCPTALKQALYFKKNNPEISVYILYRDMMTHGFNESYYTQARKSGVIFIQYSVNEKPQVTPMDGFVRVTAVEPVIGQKIWIDADIVVLATGIVPKLSGDLAESLGAKLDQDGFFAEAESKWRPVESLKEGIFACGLAHSPRNITESIATAEAAAQRALRILSYEWMPAARVVAEIRHSLCSLCERCIEACPYGARMVDVDLEKILVNAAMCQGCGACAAVCPNSASTLAGFSDPQMLDVIDSALEGTG
ncbi:MAG: FAD-dependent oxidoreductase [Desulfobacterales bacterium]